MTFARPRPRMWAGRLRPQLASDNNHQFTLEEKPMKIPRMVICVVTALAIVIGPANAVVQVNDRTDINLTVFVPCAEGGAGEIVDLNGPLHTLISFTINGNNVSGFFHFQPQGITGTGETTGAKYQATGVTQESFKNSLQNGQANGTFINNFRIIGQGPPNNFLLHEPLPFTINPSGTLTLFPAHFNAHCT